MTNVFELQNVSYRYPTSHDFLLKDISLKIEKGKLYGIIGNNGSGKTTICHLLRGFVPHFYKGDVEGQILLEGASMLDMELGDVAGKIGYIFQNPFIQISGVKETVFDEIAFGLENLGIPEEVIIESVNKILKQVDIEHLRDKNPFELSGGQRQRVALASIVVMDPDILIIDEPTSQLDPQGTEEIFKMIGTLKELGKTIVLVEHKMDLMMEYADYLFVLEDGKVVMEGETADVFSNPDYLSFHIAVPSIASMYFDLKEKGLSFSTFPLNKRELLEELESIVTRKEG
ncbi:energy-coupling factor ABC transporter ATP-binding protein [Radiobacillus kanasensis]|uniref:energy-coupling factor ABC transporter ATP-binding protein n=1 Tax=Radiobacillus kanasensis TaxID=2844358 RepID=UPI001E4FD706|nr:ABC transporter ATP-binding protein [Radiobacillus kanasensis]UFT98699.1 energy-coupling factor ABC transporter ATP-binding protein [Radiobacillus kanasensis]